LTGGAAVIGSRVSPRLKLSRAVAVGGHPAAWRAEAELFQRSESANPQTSPRSAGRNVGRDDLSVSEAEGVPLPLLDGLLEIRPDTDRKRGGETGHHVVSISNKLHDGFTSRLQKRLFVLGHLPPPLTICGDAGDERGLPGNFLLGLCPAR